MLETVYDVFVLNGAFAALLQFARVDLAPNGCEGDEVDVVGFCESGELKKYKEIQMKVVKK